MLVFFCLNTPASRRIPQAPQVQLELSFHREWDVKTTLIAI